MEIHKFYAMSKRAPDTCIHADIHDCRHRPPRPHAYMDSSTWIIGAEAEEWRGQSQRLLSRPGSWLLIPFGMKQPGSRLRPAGWRKPPTRLRSPGKPSQTAGPGLHGYLPRSTECEDRVLWLHPLRKCSWSRKGRKGGREEAEVSAAVQAGGQGARPGQRLGGD